MRIALFTELFPAWSETWNLSVAQGLLGAGHDVSIVSNVEGNIPLSLEVVKDPRILEQTYYLSPNFRVGSTKEKIHTSVTSLLQLVRNPTSITTFLKLRPFTNAFDLVSKSTMAVGYNRLPQYDLVHGLFGPSGRRAMMLEMTSEERAAVVVTFAGWDINVLAHKYGKSFYAQLFEHADLVIAASQFIKTKLLAEGVPNNKIRVLSYGVNLDALPQKQGYYKPYRPVRLVFLGRLVECKGVEYAIKMLALAKRSGVDITLDIIGDGPRFQSLKDLALANDVMELVKFHGMQPHAAALALLRDGDILICPGIRGQDGAEEALGGSILEAQAMGIPVVCTDVGGMKEAIIPNSTGVVVTSADPQALLDGVNELISRWQDWSEMGRHAREYINQNFNHTHYIEKLLKLYEEALELRKLKRIANK